MTHKSALRKKVLAMSEGVLSSLTDLALVFLNVGCELIVDPKVGRSLRYGMGRIDARMGRFNYESIKRAITHAREKGWIKGLTISSEGKKRLEGVLPEYSRSRKWQGEWYLVSFDIPEVMRKKRGILRAALKMLGFGKLQNSVWISPYNFLGNIEKIVEENSLNPYVIMSVSNKVGRVDAKTLAERIWNLSRIRNLYREFMIEFGDKKDILAHKVFFKYQSVLTQDPCLPRELLPDDWLAEEAHNLCVKILSDYKKTQKKQGTKIRQ